MGIEEKEKEVKDLVAVLSNLSREDVLMAYGYVLGLKAKNEKASQ